MGGVHVDGLVLEIIRSPSQSVAHSTDVELGGFEHPRCGGFPVGLAVALANPPQKVRF